MLAEHPGPERQKQRWLFGRCTRRLWGGEDGGVEALRVGKISICRGPGNNGGGGVTVDKVVGGNHCDKIFWRDDSGDTGSRDLKNPEQGHYRPSQSGHDGGAWMEEPGWG